MSKIFDDNSILKSDAYFFVFSLPFSKHDVILKIIRDPANILDGDLFKYSLLPKAANYCGKEVDFRCLRKSWIRFQRWALPFFDLINLL